jgi:iron complex outermembrane recepter protein
MPQKARHQGENIMKVSLKISTAAFALAAMGAGSAPAFAQDVAADEGDRKIADIVVTATRREESLNDVPIAIQALGSEALDKLGVNSFEKLLEFLPNVRAGGRGPGQNQVYIRGLATDQTGIQVSGSVGVNPSVALYLDDAPVSIPGRNLDVYAADLDRVEVLAGPQGTLFGASAQGGALRYITNKPDAREFHAGLKASYSFTRFGEDNNSVEGFINIPIIKDKLAVRFVAYSDQAGGYIDNIAGTYQAPLTNPTLAAQVARGGPVPTRPTIANAQFVENNFNDASYKGVRGSIKFDPSDDLSITVQHIRQTLDVDGVFDFDPGLGELQVQRFNPDSLNDKFNHTTWTVEGRLGALDLIYTGSYLKRQALQVVDYTRYNNVGYFTPYYTCFNVGGNYTRCATPAFTFNVNTENKRTTHEFRVSTPSDKRIRAIGGLFYDNAKIFNQEDFNYPGSIEVGFARNAPIAGTTANNPNPRAPGITFFNDTQRRDRQLAAFGEVAVDIVPEQLTLTGGLRYFDSRAGFKGSANFANLGVDGNSGRNLDQILRNLSPRKDSGFIFKGNLTYKPNSDLLFYATYSEGFRPGGFNRGGGPSNVAGVSIPFAYDTDSVVNYELGAKLSLLDRSLQINLAAYQINAADLQVSIFEQRLSNLTFVANVADARIRGLEGDISWRATRGLTINSGFSYNKTKLTSANLQAQPLASLNPLGSPLALSPKFQGNFRARYDHELSNGAKVFGQFGTHFVGKSVSSIVRTRSFALDSYFTADTSVGLEKDDWGIELYVNNLTDKRPELFKDTVDNQLRTTTSRPRTIGLRVSYKI